MNKDIQRSTKAHIRQKKKNEANRVDALPHLILTLSAMLQTKLKERAWRGNDEKENTNNTEKQD